MTEKDMAGAHIGFHESMNDLKDFSVYLGAINWLQFDVNLLMGGVQGGEVGGQVR